MVRRSMVAASLLIGLCAQTCAGPAQAAEVLLADPGNYFESFLGAGARSVGPQSSDRGRAIVGLHLGHGNGSFDLSKLRVLVPKMDFSVGYCVRMTSFDGRYWSLNGYKQAAPDAVPVSVETRSRYSAELLKRYRSDDVSIEISATSDCDQQSTGTLIPAIPPGATDYGTLIVYLNVPGSRAAARLLDTKGVLIAAAHCRLAPDDQTIAFTETCEFSPANASWTPATHLEIALVGDQGAPTKLSYDLKLPGRGP